MAEIELRGVGKRFPGGTEAVRQLDLTIRDGEVFILVGPSGCGKSTILNMIVGLEEPTEGEVRVDGKNVSGLDPRDRNMAMVFQSYAIYPHMTVRENMAFPLRLAKVDDAERNRRVEEAAAILELEELLDRKPEALSGGQRQRVAMGRAIVREPVAFLLDEPLSNLDAKLRAQMRTEIARLQRRLETTMVYVTHDQAEAMTLGDTIAVLRKGRLQQVGSPRELYQEPRNLFVAGFIGSPPTNFLPARVRDGRLVLPMGDLPFPEGVAGESLREESELIVGIRPEDFLEVEPANGPAEPDDGWEADRKSEPDWKSQPDQDPDQKPEAGADVAPVRDGDRGVGMTFEVTPELVEWMGADLYVHFQVETGEREGMRQVSERLRELARDLELEEPREGRRRLTARLAAGSRAREGIPLTLEVHPDRIMLFDTEEGARMPTES